MTLRSEISPTPAHLTSRGTIAAGFLGAAAAVVIAMSLAGGISRDAAGIGLSAGGVVGAAIGLALFWRLLVPRMGTYSLAYSVLAGVLGAIAAHVFAWLFFFIAASVVAAELLPDLARAFGFTISLLATSIILAGMVTIPAGVAVALAVTLWCRWQLGARTL